MNLSTITLQDLVCWAVAASILLSGIVEFSKIRINPWSWLARKIGHAVNGEVIDKVDKLETRLNEMEKKDEEREILNARIRILRFGDECQHDVHHSQEHFEQILADVDRYDEYCRTHPGFKNNKAKVTITKIQEAYASCREHNDFL